MTLVLRRVGISASLAAPLVVGCIAYDEDIRVSLNLNEHAVRFVEPTPLLQASHKACIKENTNLKGCPMPPAAGPPHLLNPEDPEYDFCTCPEGERDESPLRRFTLHVEDQDGRRAQPRGPSSTDESGKSGESGDESGEEANENDEREDEARDSLFAALLLDTKPGSRGPAAASYTSTVNPDRVLRDSYGARPGAYSVLGLNRPVPDVRELVVPTVDLCNPLEGPSLAPGWHSLTVIVTDRPWFSSDGERRNYGIPDISAGASYDTAHYSFHCAAPDDAESSCSCVDDDELPSDGASP